MPVNPRCPTIGIVTNISAPVRTLSPHPRTLPAAWKVHHTSFWPLGYWLASSSCCQRSLRLRRCTSPRHASGFVDKANLPIVREVITIIGPTGREQVLENVSLSLYI